MIFNLKESLFIEDAAIKDGDSLIARNSIDGKFYEENTRGVWVPVPDWKQEQCQQKYFLEVTHRKKALEKGINLDDAKLKDVERSAVDLSNIGQKILDKGKQAQMYQREQDEKDNVEARARIQAQRARRGSDRNALATTLKLEISDFITNLLYQRPKFRKKKDMMTPDPWCLDPRLPSWKTKKNKKDPIERKKFDKKPIVLFFYDRSCSFNPNSYPQKTALGEALVQMFEEWSDQIELLPIVYFAKHCHSTEKAALDEGDNDGGILLQEIEKRTTGKIANVVILTDDNSDWGITKSIDVCGSVWCIFAESEAMKFYNSINVVNLPDGTPGKKCHYFFKSIK